jgi:hypothetical protein
MASEPEATSFTVEVKHGKEKVEVTVDASDATVGWLMETLEVGRSVTLRQNSNWTTPRMVRVTNLDTPGSDLP